MLTFLILGFAAIRRGEVANHNAWMMRAFGLALRAGTPSRCARVIGAIARPGRAARLRPMSRCRPLRQ